ncbi:DNA internalization-related competence protein ComEC/Rec2 [Candidatus Saganbacteria bacterium]|nr:DNA internalization-related competence protein ComEC/Rec2 [Candidatus Saganbacteria bacterium]
MIFKRPIVAIALFYALVVILLRPLLPLPAEIKPHEQEPFPLNVRFMEVIQKTTPAPYDALLGSIVFGTSVSPLDPDLKDSYKKVGLAHLLVASGTQVSILIGVCLMIIRTFKLPIGLGVVAASMINVLFAVMTGLGPSILRAAMMGEITLFGIWLNREGEIYNSLGLAALILMIFDPLVIFGLSFQLTFAATWALVYLAPVLEKKYRLPSPLAISLAPILATIPITLYNFNQFSVAALLVNVIVMPWVEILTVLGFASTVLGAVFLPIAAVLNGTLLLILKLFNEIVYTFSAIPGACLYFPAPPFFFILAYYAGLVMWVEGFMNKRNLLKYSLLCLALFIWAAAFSPSVAIKGLTISVIDVGQGDSILVESPSGKTMLIDGGPKYKRGDAGRRFVLPFLHKKGINKLDLVVLTHPHDDHVGGLPSVLKDLPVGLIFDSGQPHTSRAYLDFINLVAQKKIAYKVARAGQMIDLGGGVKGEILNPQEPFIEESALNNNSVVIRLVFGKIAIMLTGDMEKEGEQRVLAMGYELRSQILKAGHHGSRTSSSLEFLEAVQPEAALISVGVKNSYHHPHPSTLKKFEEMGIRVYRTDLDGNLSVSTDGEKYIISQGYKGKQGR